MTDRTTIRELLRLKGFKDEIYETSVFHGRRENGQSVRIEIRDLGSDYRNQGGRYICIGVREDGKTICGNAEATADQAVAVVHWDDLD